MAITHLLSQIEGLITELESVRAEVTSIDHQLSLHREMVQAGQKPGDPDWVRRAEYARDCRRDRMSALERRIEIVKLKLQHEA